MYATVFMAEGLQIVKFKFLVAVLMKIQVYWDVILCRFGYCC